MKLIRGRREAVGERQEGFGCEQAKTQGCCVSSGSELFSSEGDDWVMVQLRGHGCVWGDSPETHSSAGLECYVKSKLFTPAASVPLLLPLLDDELCAALEKT